MIPCPSLFATRRMPAVGAAPPLLRWSTNAEDSPELPLATAAKRWLSWVSGSGRRCSATFATSPSRWLRSQCRGRCCRDPLAERPGCGHRLPQQERRAGVRCDATREEVCLDGGSTACRHAEPYFALLRTPIGEILASRLPEHPEDVGALRAGCGYFDKNGKGGR